MIEPAFRRRAEDALAAVETEEGGRILFAIESGSRAWGFASSDSDYDVRFVFLRPVADYLRISPPRDVIERPIDSELDLAGWDLRKALGLMIRSNAVLLEWLASPIVYRLDPRPMAWLRTMARDAAHCPALAHHYDRLARGAWAPGEADMRLKSYFYALRPALALLWLRDLGKPPPMDLPSLRAGVSIPPAVSDAVDLLLHIKATAPETAAIRRDAALEQFLAEILARSVPRPPAWEREPARIAADGLFAAMALGRQI